MSAAGLCSPGESPGAHSVVESPVLSVPCLLQTRYKRAVQATSSYTGARAGARARRATGATTSPLPPVTLPRLPTPPRRHAASVTVERHCQGGSSRRSDKFTLVDLHESGSASLARARTLRSYLVRMAGEEGQGVGQGTRLKVQGQWGLNNSEIQAQQVQILRDPAAEAAPGAPASGVPGAYPPALSRGQWGLNNVEAQAQQVEVLKDPSAQAGSPARAPASCRGRYPQALSRGPLQPTPLVTPDPEAAGERRGQIPKPLVVGLGLKLGSRVKAASAAPVSPPAKQLAPPPTELAALERDAAGGPKPGRQELLRRSEGRKAATGSGVTVTPFPRQAARPGRSGALKACPCACCGGPSSGGGVSGAHRSTGEGSSVKSRGRRAPARLPRHAVQVSGVVTKVVYHNEANGYTVLCVHAPDAPLRLQPSSRSRRPQPRLRSRARGGKWQKGSRVYPRGRGRRRRSGGGNGP